MKKSKIILICLMLLSFVVVGIGFGFLDDIIPIHFGVDGTPDQFASKYLILIIPTISALIGIAMLLVCKYGKVSENYQKYLLLTGIIIEAIFVVVTSLIVIYAITSVDENNAFDISKVMMPVIGAMFIVMSNFMPKIEKNRTLGIKTSWSMYNEVTWQKTHRFAGFMGVIVGTLILVAGLFFEGLVNAIILMSLLVIFMVATTVASYRYYKEEKAKNV